MDNTKSMIDTLQEVDVDSIFIDNDFNCRGQVIPFDVIKLAESITEIGLQCPITIHAYVHPDKPKIKWRVIAGNRRVMACRVAKVKTIPAIVKNNLDESELRRLNLIENICRVDLNIKQEAHGIKDFVTWGWTNSEIAEWVGTSEGWVNTRKILLTLPDDVQDAAAAGFLTHEQVKQMKGKSETQIYAALQDIKLAKIKGEKIKVQDKKDARNPLAKIKPTTKEIFAMQMLIVDYLGFGFHSRITAWVNAEISDYDLYKALEDYCKTNTCNKKYVIPESLKLQILNGKAA